MTKIRNIKDTNNENFYPVTHERAVRDSSGKRLDEKLAEIEQSASDPNAVKYTEQSLNDNQKTQARTNIGANEQLNSGVNIKTINNQSLLGSGNIQIQNGNPDSVLYTEQSLTSSQQEQARINIGACGSVLVTPEQSEINLYPTVNYTAQSLTSSQQAQARQNIGAGTSSFSGDYRDLTNKPEIPSITPVSTNINSDRTTDGKVASSKAVYDAVHPQIETVRYSWGMYPNVYYNLGTLTGTVNLQFATPEDNTIVNHYYFCFDIGNTIPTVTWPSEITDWFGIAAPTLVSGHHYEVSVINGIAAYLEV